MNLSLNNCKLKAAGGLSPSAALVGSSQRLVHWRSDQQAGPLCRASAPGSQPVPNLQGASSAAPPPGPQKPRPGARRPVAGAPSTSGRPPVGSYSSLVYKEGEFVELGEIVTAHGVKGEVKVDISTDSPEKRFGKKGTRLYLKPPNPKGLLALGQVDSTPLIELTTNGYKVQHLPEGKQIWILSFKEFQDRTVAEQLRQYMLVLPCTEREELSDPDEFYAQDLVGSYVYNLVDGAYMGKVVELFSGFGTSETLQINLRPTKQDLDNCIIRTCMVPFVKSMVPIVDKQNRRIVVSLPDGLLDLASTKKIKPLDETRKAARLQEIARLEEEERQRRLLQPVQVPAGSSSGGGRVKAINGDVDSDDEEGEGEAPEKQQQARPPARRPRPSGARRPLRLNTSAR